MQRGLFGRVDAWNWELNARKYRMRGENSTSQASSQSNVSTTSWWKFIYKMSQSQSWIPPKLVPKLKKCKESLRYDKVVVIFLLHKQKRRKGHRTSWLIKLWASICQCVSSSNRLLSFCTFKQADSAKYTHCPWVLDFSLLTYTHTHTHIPATALRKQPLSQLRKKMVLDQDSVPVKY